MTATEASQELHSLPRYLPSAPQGLAASGPHRRGHRKPRRLLTSGLSGPQGRPRSLSRLPRSTGFSAPGGVGLIPSAWRSDWEGYVQRHLCAYIRMPLRGRTYARIARHAEDHQAPPTESSNRVLNHWFAAFKLAGHIHGNMPDSAVHSTSAHRTADFPRLNRRLCSNTTHTVSRTAGSTMVSWNLTYWVAVSAGDMTGEPQRPQPRRHTQPSEAGGLQKLQQDNATMKKRMRDPHPPTTRERTVPHPGSHPMPGRPYHMHELFITHGRSYVRTYYISSPYRSQPDETQIPVPKPSPDVTSTAHPTCPPSSRPQTHPRPHPPD